MLKSLVFYFAENVCALFDHHGTVRSVASGDQSVFFTKEDVADILIMDRKRMMNLPEVSADTRTIEEQGSVMQTEEIRICESSLTRDMLLLLMLI